MALPYADGNFTTWQASGPLSIEYSEQGETGTFIVSQKYVGLVANYTAPNITGEVHSTYNTAYCVGDSGFSILGAGVAEVTRSFVNVANTNTYADYAYQFPGVLNYRDPFTRTVRARIQIDYFFNAVPDVVSKTRFYLTSYDYADVLYLNDGGAGVEATTPSATDYTANYIDNANVELVAADSTITRYRGNIWRRETVYIPAK
jgi:hypothetical protein